MADVVKGLTHLAVNQAFVSSSLIIRPTTVEMVQYDCIEPFFFVFVIILAIFGAKMCQSFKYLRRDLTLER